MTQAEQIESLQHIVENMATQHVMFEVKGSRKKLHPDWCPLCRLEKAEQIGSPKAIAAWVEQVVLPELAARNGLPEKSIERGAAHIGFSAGDLIRAIREAQVFP